MIVPRRLLAVLALGVVVTLGCGPSESPQTDPESLKRGAEEINRMSKQENEAKKGQKQKNAE